MFDYVNINGKSGIRAIRVFVEKRRVGTIIPVDGGWQYFPGVGRIGGEIFKTIEQVKRSLESE